MRRKFAKEKGAKVIGSLRREVSNIKEPERKVTSAIHGAARNEAYASTKGAMLAMIRGLSVEMARYGITANSIIPGWIETAMTSPRVGDERFEDRVMKRVPVRRWGRPEDFAGIAVYLASDASAYQTGEDFVIDGGYTRF